MSKKQNDMMGVIFNNVDNQYPYVDCDQSTFYLPFYKHEDEYFSSYENYINFIKECEKLVRKHKYYKKHKKVLIEVVGMKTCQVLSNISTEDDPKEKITMEMHHGPLLTLFDVCTIVLNSLMAKEDPFITTFRVANIVIEEHRLMRVRCVLLTKTVHQLVTEGKVILNYNMGVGDTAEFLKIYSDGLDNNLIHKINKYIKWSMENDSTDSELLEVASVFREWGCNDFDDFDEVLNYKKKSENLT